MTWLEIYQHQEMILRRQICRSFYIMEDYDVPGRIIWSIDDDQRIGIIKLWVQAPTSNPQIVLALPEWDFLIDGVKQKSQKVVEIDNLKGKTIEVTGQDYRFIIHFQN